MGTSEKIFVCGKDSTSQYLSCQLNSVGYSTMNITSNPLDIAFECLREKPVSIFVNSTIEQPVRLIENLRKEKNGPLVFVIKSQKDLIPNKKLEELADGFYYQPLDINMIINELAEKSKNKKECALNKDLYKDSYDKKLYNHISDILKNLCVTPNYNGYTYLREAIKIALNQPISSRGFSTKIYPLIAEKFEVSSASIERNIRTAINKSWDRASTDIKADMFGLFAANKQWKPTNSEYILIIADMINRDYGNILQTTN